MPELRLTIPAELDGQTVRQAAMKGLGMSNGLFKRAKFHGQVLLDSVPVLANAAVRQGQTLLLFFPEKENTAPAPVELGLRVAFEDENLMMVDKPAPLPSASSPRQALPTLENAVYAYLGCPYRGGSPGLCPGNGVHLSSRQPAGQRHQRPDAGGQDRLRAGSDAAAFTH